MTEQELKQNRIEFEQFKAIRKELGISIKELSQTLGYNPKSLYVVIRKDRKLPRWVKAVIMVYGKTKYLHDVKS